MQTAVGVENLSFAYNSQKVLEDIDLRIEPGEFIAIVGPNGGGKTTLLRVMLGLLKPGRGAVRIMGKSPDKAHRHIGYVPQYGVKYEDFPVRVREVVMTGGLTAGSILPFWPSDLKSRAKEMLDQMEIASLADTRYGDLSGGQKQRTLIARALISDPDILFLDEPTASVDMRMELGIFDLLKSIGKTIVLVTHDIGFVSSYADRVACLNRRLVVHMTSEINADVISGTYHDHMEIISHRCGL